MLIRRSGSQSGIDGVPFSSAVHATAPAKINLFLEVLGKRPDGFHAIETVMLAVDLLDELTLDADPSGQVSLTCDQPDLPTGADNLVIKAARLLQQRTACSIGAAIGLTKRIPWSAGLGGGSSDAASALAGLNELWRLGLSPDELKTIGAELGSDVPFFFAVPAALCTGRGEVIEPVLVGKAFDLVLAKPPVGLDTGAVYREFARRPNADCRGANEVMAALADGNLETLGRCLHNRLQEPAVRLCPAVADLLTRFQALGVAGSMMSGSGSCVFALCRDPREAQQVAVQLLGGLPPDSELARTRVFVTRSCF